MRVGNSKPSGSTRNSEEIIPDNHTDYYRLLCIEPSETLLLIKKNYRYLVKRFHPGLITVEHNNEVEIIRSINEAYEILSDPSTHLQYDRNKIKKVSKK